MRNFFIFHCRYTSVFSKSYCHNPVCQNQTQIQFGSTSHAEPSSVTLMRTNFRTWTDKSSLLHIRNRNPKSVCIIRLSSSERAFASNFECYNCRLPQTTVLNWNFLFSYVVFGPDYIVSTLKRSNIKETKRPDCVAFTQCPIYKESPNYATFQKRIGFQWLQSIFRERELL